MESCLLLCLCLLLRSSGSTTGTNASRTAGVPGEGMENPIPGCMNAGLAERLGARGLGARMTLGSTKPAGGRSSTRGSNTGSGSGTNIGGGGAACCGKGACAAGLEGAGVGGMIFAWKDGAPRPRLYAPPGLRPRVGGTGLPMGAIRGVGEGAVTNGAESEKVGTAGSAWGRLISGTDEKPPGICSGAGIP